MLKAAKTILAFSAFIFLQLFSNSASADWFLSSDTKALIAKAEAGDIDAQFRVGGAYDTGNGAPRDKATAMKWYRMAADGGSVEAQNSVGSLLQEQGKYADAMSWYQRAAEQGHAQAINNVAYLYDLGLGVPQDRKKGLELYSRAADLGSAEAMWNIANMYGAGQLGPTDLVMACVWGNRALRFAGPRDKRLSAHLQKILPQLEGGMETEKVIACREQANSWRPSKDMK